MLVGEIAYEQVRPDVRARVGALVRTLDNRYNNHKPYNFVTVGCYMDDTRAEKGYPYSAWHYMDVNYIPDGSGYSEPAPPHVLWALQQAVATFENPTATGPQEALALAMLIHFTGDIHQPLHCVDWNDKGGNGYFIAGVPFSDLSKKKPANLHAFWDRAYRFGVQDGKVIELYYSPWPAERPTVRACGGGDQRAGCENHGAVSPGQHGGPCQCGGSPRVGAGELSFCVQVRVSAREDIRMILKWSRFHPCSSAKRMRSRAGASLLLAIAWQIC